MNGGCRFRTDPALFDTSPQQFRHPGKVRRGLLKDLANTPTQMACGYRMYSDLKPLRSMDGSEIVIDLLSGSVTQDGREVSQTLLLAGDVVSWMAERLERDGIPIGTIAVATLTLKPRLQDAGGLVIGCSTVLRTNAGILESEDVARWHPIDVRD